MLGRLYELVMMQRDLLASSYQPHTSIPRLWVSQLSIVMTRDLFCNTGLTQVYSVCVNETERD